MSAREVFALGAVVVFRGKAMRVVGRMQLEGANGQRSSRYHLSDGAGAPVLLEQVADRFALLRPFPPEANPPAAGNTVTIGDERYTLAGVRRLTVLEALGQVPGAAPRAQLLLSGMLEGPMGALMRELVPGATGQVYYLVKPLAAGEVLSEAAFAALRAAERRAAAERDADD